MRNHTMEGTANQEPWQFGDRVESICREYIELRYRLLPYIYSLFHQAATTGAPVMAPLLYYYPNDVKTYQLHDQVMLGEWLMAARESSVKLAIATTSTLPNVKAVLKHALDAVNFSPFKAVLLSGSGEITVKI